MTTSTLIMMLIGCGTVWGGAVVTILIALAVEKRIKLKGGNE